MGAGVVRGTGGGEKGSALEFEAVILVLELLVLKLG